MWYEMARPRKQWIRKARTATLGGQTTLTVTAGVTTTEVTELPHASRVFESPLPHSAAFWPPMGDSKGDFNIFREQLSIKYSTYGHALWEPSPAKENDPVKIGDVGFIRSGKFHRLFNALLSAEVQTNVPEHYEQLVPKLSNHISRGTLSSNHYCSDGINVELESDVHALARLLRFSV